MGDWVVVAGKSETSRWLTTNHPSANRPFHNTLDSRQALQPTRLHVQKAATSQSSVSNFFLDSFLTCEKRVVVVVVVVVALQLFSISISISNYKSGSPSGRIHRILGSSSWKRFPSPPP